MNFFRKFTSSSLRFKILFGMLLSLVPMLAISAITYYSARNETLEHSERLMDFINQQGAKAINGFIKVQEDVFLNWTQDDIFGMAIEFQTIQELQSEFISMLKNQRGFCLLMLTDNAGKVVTAVARERFEGKNADALVSRFIKEAPVLMQAASHFAFFAKSDFMKHIGQNSEYTYAFSFKTKDSLGRPNGLFLAYLDWSKLQDMVINLLSDNMTNGFEGAQVAILDPANTIAFSHSNTDLIDQPMKISNELKSWLKESVGGEVRKFGRKNKFEFVTFSLIQGPDRIPGAHAKELNASKLCLTTFVPENDIMSAVQRILHTSIGIGGVGGILIILIAGFFLSDIRRKFNQFLKVFEDMSQGDITNQLEIEGDDEFAEAAISFNRLVGYLQEVVSVCEGVAVGDYNRIINEKGNNDLLGNAIVRMTTTLREVTQQQELQNWLKSGQAELNDNMRGEHDVTSLAQIIITFLANYLDAKVGAIYLADEENRLKLAGTYAYTKRKQLSNVYELGEGLVGQAALEKKEILLTNVPEDYIAINSGIGGSAPTSILVMPFIYEEKPKGVIELGSLKEFTDKHISFLKTITGNIAVAINSTQSRSQMAELLQKTQIQAEELQQQQDKLKASNEELEEQTTLLKESEARLQRQQEELQQINEELQEKSQALEREKENVEKRNAELKKAQKIIEEKARDLELTSKYKSEFLANMSHELRTPLNSLLILSKLLTQNKGGNLSEKEVEYASNIHSAGSDLLNLINEVLDLSRVEAGKLELNIEKISLTDLAGNIERSFRHIADEKGLSLDIDIAPGLPASIRSDRQRLEQILRNLLSNALKFTDKGGVHFTMCRPRPDTEFSASELVPAKTIALAVSDTGKGVAAGKQKLIFEAFQQEDGTTSRKYGGTGLGLSISREIAKLLGGEIHLQSQEGKGSTFTLFLPETVETATSAEKTDQVPAGAANRTKTNPAKVSEYKPSGLEVIRDDRRNITPDDRSILVIEDDPNFAKILFDLVHQNGFKCLVAEDGETGLHFADHHRPSAIILDIGLPGIDGWNVMERLKNNLNTRHIPVHFISASDEASRAMKMGAIGYLVKPVNIEMIDKTLNDIENMILKQVKRLLIVEDDEHQRKAIIELVKGKDVEISEAGSGQEAYELLKSKPSDCVILDLGLPDTTGFEFLEKIKKDKTLGYIPIIIYTSRDLSKEEEAKLKHYAQSIIVKGVKKSNERLLDETSLFLHSLEANMPEDKRKIIRMIHDKDSLFENKKILLVDDDMRNLFALTNVLEEKGVRVFVGKNGKEGLERLNDHPDIDLVLMDIMMPEMDGYEALRKIRQKQQFADLPIIALTAKAMKGDRHKCIQAGANDYLSKPIDPDKLLSLLRVWLYEKNMTQPPERLN